MTHVVLTGAAGFAGSHALRHFLTNTEWTFACPVTLDHKGSLLRLESAMAGHALWRVKVIPLDLAKDWTSRSRDELGEPSYIINYASDSHVDRSVLAPAPFILNNVGLMIKMLEFARDFPYLKAFAQISTDEVYGPAEVGTAHAEWSPIIPSNPYSASKAAQEAIAISYWRTFGVPLIITNTMNMIGEYQDKEKFVPMCITRINAGKTVMIHGTADGQSGSRCWIHARNLADAILFLLKRSRVTRHEPAVAGTQMPDRWNVVGEEHTNLEIAQMVAQALDKPLRYEVIDYHSSRPGHDLRYALSGKKLEAAGWKSPAALAETLKSVVRWEKQFL